MSVIADHNVKLVGNEVHFLAGAGDSQTLQPSRFFDVSADVVGGTISVSMESLDFHRPSFVRVTGPRVDPEDPDGEGPGSAQTWYNCVPISVELFHDGEAEPVRSIRTANGEKREGEQESQFTVDAGPIALAFSPKRWRLRVTNTSNKVVAANGGLGYVRDRDFIGETRVPMRVLNHSFGVVLNAMAPHARISGRTLRFGFSKEVAETLGLQGDHPLRDRTVELDDIPDFVNIKGELQTIQAEVTTGATVRAAVHDQWRELEKRLLRQLQTTTDWQLRALIERAREENNEWRADWEAKVEPDLVAVHFTALVSDIDLTTDLIPGFEFDLGSIKDVTVHLYFAFKRSVSHRSGHVLFLASPDYEGLIAAANWLGLVRPVKMVADKLVPAIEEHSGLLHRYFAEVLARIAPFLGDVPSIFIDARADDTGVIVRYTADPAERRARVPPPPRGTPVHGTIRVGETRVPLGNGGVIVWDPAAPPVDRGPRGTMPTEFALGDPQSLARLDKIETIVVVMMENRSFDHMLGYLRTVRGEKYKGFPNGASNNYIKDGFWHTVEMKPITDVLRLPDVMQIPVDPYHGFNHIKVQVADGAMSGFATDLQQKADPQFALSYYTDRQIPNYYRLAADHMVCNHWYCAHPGATYPNRWATLTGTMPQLHNFHVDDRRLGFMRDRTIFELLSNEGIDWNYYENNVSMIRMYQQYRLDDKNVLPFLDRDEGFEAKAKAGTLPAVVFVEPRFTGIPPLEQASDDHPPANVAVGQQFITRVYNALVNSPEQWKRTLLLITYDEHGGFYDHVPPPGTRLGPPEWLNKVPRIHPEGADYMGVRCPTFVISPFVNPGTVCNAVFDHTSILKTILVRHRQRFYKEQFGWFGPRVMMINHLGAALDRDEPRPGRPEPLPDPPRRQLERRATPPSRGTPRRRPTAPPADADESTDFHVSLARAMLPKRS